MTEEEQKTDEVFKKFKEGFEEVFEGDLLFKTLRDHGVTVETDVNNWDETSCGYPRYSPAPVGSHGNLKIIRENEDFKPSENGQYVVRVDSEGNAFSACNRYGYRKLSDDNCLREGKALGSVFATIFRKVLLSALKEYGKLLEEYKDGIYLKKKSVDVPASDVAIEPDFIAAWSRARERYPSAELLVLLPGENYLKHYNQYYREALERCIEAKYIVPCCVQTNEKDEIDCGFIFPASAIEILHKGNLGVGEDPYGFKVTVVCSCCYIDARILPAEQVARFKCPAEA